MVFESRQVVDERALAVPDGAGSHDHHITSRPSVPCTATATAVGKTRNKQSAKRQSYAFSILTLTTISSIICWVPLSVADIVLIIAPFRPGTLVMLLSRLFITQAVLDPILFTTASDNIRRGFQKVFRPLFSRADG